MNACVHLLPWQDGGAVHFLTYCLISRFERERERERDRMGVREGERERFISFGESFMKSCLIAEKNF